MERRPSHPSRETQLKMLGRDPAHWAYLPSFAGWRWEHRRGRFLGYELTLHRDGCVVTASFRKPPRGNGRGFRWRVFARYDNLRLAQERAYSDFAQHILEIEG